NDGRLDLLITGGTKAHRYAADDRPFYPITTIYHNNVSPANSRPVAPVTPASGIIANQANLTWNAATDDHTPANALTYNIRVGSTPGGCEVFAPSSNVATGYRRIPSRGNMGHLRNQTLSLPDGMYYWSIQSLD